MTSNSLGAQNPYDPNRLIDALRNILNLDSDMALSQCLDLPAPVISQIRHRGHPVGPSILIRMHDVTKLSVQELREIMGDRRHKTRTAYDEWFLADSGSDSRKSAVKAAPRDSRERYFYLFLMGTFVCVLWYMLLRR
jgi:hypothetical protein